MAEPSPHPAVSVVIPTHNRRALMTEMLAALANQAPGTPAFEVVAVADGCIDGTPAMLRDWHGTFPVRVLELPGRGPAEARNAGAAAAQADLLLFLDDDVLPTPGLVAAHHAAHRDQPGGAVVGPYPPAPFASREPFRQDIRRWWIAHFDALARPGHRFGFRDLLTGNLSMSRELWDRIGGLDAQFARAREDLELGVRLVAAGVPIRYAPRAFGWHHEHHTSTLAGAFRRAREEGRSDARMAFKHPHLGPVLDIVRLAAVSRSRPLRWLLRGKGGDYVEPLLPVLVALLGLTGRLGLRRPYRRLFALLHGFAYHRGGRAAVDGAWWKLAELYRPAQPAEPLAIDLADGFDAAAARISAERPRAVSVALGGRTIGMLPDEPGREPYDAPQFRAALVERLGEPVLRVLTGRTDPATSAPPGWSQLGDRDFDRLLAEQRRQWARAGL